MSGQEDQPSPPQKSALDLQGVEADLCMDEDEDPPQSLSVSCLNTFGTATASATDASRVRADQQVTDEEAILAHASKGSGLISK
eukprot:1137879-Pelagomonas_calceolata.AAC.5